MAWEEGTSHTDISCIFDAKNSNYSFFETYTYVKADCNISNKVIRSIQQKLGDYVYSIIFRVINSNEPSKASVVYHSLQKLLNTEKNILIIYMINSYMIYLRLIGKFLMKLRFIGR